MSRAVLHVGAHKTGTTTLQHLCALNRALLARHGVIYPEIGPGQGHHALLAIWSHVPKLPAQAHAADRAKALLADLSARHAGGRDTLLLSAESFSRAVDGPDDGPDEAPAAGSPPQGAAAGFRGADMADLRHRLRGFGSFRVLYVDRHPMDLLQAVYLQLNRTRLRDPFAAFLQQALQTGRAGGLWCDPNRLHDHLLSGFAPAEIRYAAYQPLRAQPAGLERFLLQELDCGLTPDDLEPLPKNRNVSPGPLAWLLACGQSRPRPPGNGVIAVAAEVLADRFGPGRGSTLYTRAEAAAARAHFAPLVARLGDRVAAAQPDFTPCPGALHADMIHREDLDATLQDDLAARVAARMAEHHRQTAPDPDTGP